MRLISILTTVLLVACGGGGSSAPEENPTPTPAQPHKTAMCLLLKAHTSNLANIGMEHCFFRKSGMCPDEVQSVIDYAFLEGNDTGAIIVIRNGYIVIEEYDSGKTEMIWQQVGQWEKFC